ncbi:MAG: HEAT repeat domain-containing protein, partial [Chthoniobacterales bacterium]
ALLQPVEKSDADAFAKAFAAWLDSGAMRDRQCKFAEMLDEKLAARCNVAALTAEKKTPLPAAPRLPPDVLFEQKIPAQERMKLLAQLAQFWNYDRFVVDRADALKVVQAAPADSDTVRRAAFWELRGDRASATAGTIALRKLVDDPSPAAAQLLAAIYFGDSDQEVTGAARMAMKAKNKEFIALLLHRIETKHDQGSSRAARQLCQEGVVGAQPIMLEWLKDKDREIRNGAALNLCWANRKENVPALLEAISAEKDPETKSLLLVALAQTGDKRSLDVLEAASREKKMPPWATLEIFRGLARAGDPQALAALAEAAVAFETSGGDEEDRVQLQAEAVNAFGLISKLYPAHEPDPLWQEGGWNSAAIAKNIATIKKWQQSHSPPAKK